MHSTGGFNAQAMLGSVAARMTTHQTQPAGVCLAPTASTSHQLRALQDPTLPTGVQVLMQPAPTRQQLQQPEEHSWKCTHDGRGRPLITQRCMLQHTIHTWQRRPAGELGRLGGLCFGSTCALAPLHRLLCSRGPAHIMLHALCGAAHGVWHIRVSVSSSQWLLTPPPPPSPCKNPHRRRDPFPTAHSPTAGTCHPPCLSPRGGSCFFLDGYSKCCPAHIMAHGKSTYTLLESTCLYTLARVCCTSL
jgi:hypothetical protein